MTQPPSSPASSTPAPPVKVAWYKRPLLFGVAGGLAYGLLVQLAARTETLKQLWSVMAFGFVFLLPLSLGFLTAHWGAKSQPRSFWFYVTSPQLTVLASMVCALVVGWEGLICMVLALPVYMVMGAVGGALAYAAAQWSKRRAGKLPVFLTGFVMMLPPGAAALENLRTHPRELRKVQTKIEIVAPTEKVWSQIIRVPPIVEPTTGVFYRMGFPKPIEATLSHEGVGGVRHARFERGLDFIETVDEWKELEQLSFSIEVDPAATPLTTLDEHVTVGGEYFDVMRGTYRIEQQPGGVVLHLESEFRLSTAFNTYAGFWGEFLMRDIQMSILRVIKQRCER